MTKARLPAWLNFYELRFHDPCPRYGIRKVETFYEDVSWLEFYQENASY